VLKTKEIDAGDIPIRLKVDIECAHEARRRHPKVVPDEDDRLDALTVALSQRSDQLGILFASPGEKPLLELVKDQQDLPAGPKHKSTP
jgi:hypothetical protein